MLMLIIGTVALSCLYGWAIMRLVFKRGWAIGTGFTLSAVGGAVAPLITTAGATEPLLAMAACCIFALIASLITALASE